MVSRAVEQLTEDEIRRRLGTLDAEVLRTTMCFEIRQYDDTYVDKRYLGHWYADVSFPSREQLTYDEFVKIATHLGTTTLSFQSATEHGYYGESTGFVRLWVCW